MLSGGGPIGIGWHSGMVAAFTDAGIDVAKADLFVGTSAGSVVCAQVAQGRKPLDELNSTVEERPESRYAKSIGDNMQKLMTLMMSSYEMEPLERLKALGAFALEAPTAPEDSFVRRFRHLDEGAWPERFVCTAIDAVDGTFKPWDAASRVELAKAVASSCSVPGFFPPITIDGRRYIDGGMRSITNADLAAGSERVLILTLFQPPEDVTSDPRTERMRATFESEAKAIHDGGGQQLVLSPDEQTQAVIGINLMDASKTPDAAEAGYAQGQRVADRVAEFWDPT